MDEKQNENINSKVDIWTRLVFILRYIFFGFLIWSYYSTVFRIGSEGGIGGGIGIIALVMFLIFKGGINPIKINNSEFGKYTDIIGILISLIFVFSCLVPLFGIGFHK